MTTYEILRKVLPEDVVVALVNNTAEALEWDPGKVARWCALVGADFAAVQETVRFYRMKASALAGSHHDEFAPVTVAVRHPFNPDVRMVINERDLTEAHERWPDD